MCVCVFASVCLGPFWICVTLVFSVAISGNLSTFLSEMGNPAYHYRPQFHRGQSFTGSVVDLNSSCYCYRVEQLCFVSVPCFLLAVTIAAVVIFMYAWLVPIGLWGFLTWRQGTERQIGGYSFLETVCVYGYSLFIYIPTSVSPSSRFTYGCQGYNRGLQRKTIPKKNPRCCLVVGVKMTGV